MPIWNPWRGCHKYSEGCKFCYIHKGDYKRGIDTHEIVITKDFNKPIKKDKYGNYKIKPGEKVYLGFSTDFLIKDADKWRDECWSMIKKGSDLKFIFLTKRIERFMECIPNDWDNGYDNAVVGCSIETQDIANYRLPIFKRLPIKHKNIICQLLIEKISILRYIDDIEFVLVGGESDYNGRVLDFDWVLSLRKECIDKNVKFEFRQCATHFIKDNKKYTLNNKQLRSQAKKANIDFGGN